MIPLIITSVRHAVPRCCKGNVTGLEPLSCDNEWLVGDAHLSNGCQNCEKCDLCPIQDNEVVIDWFCAVMWGGAIKMSNSPIGCANEFACPAEFVEQKVGCAENSSINKFSTF